MLRTLTLRSPCPNCLTSKHATRRDGVRFSFHVYNTLDDVNAALTVLEDNLDLMVRW